MISQMVRFGGYVNIQVSYKILWLEVLKKALILHNLESFDFAQSALLSRGVVLRQLWTQCGLGCLGVKLKMTDTY
jgi:hypothetical protein